MRIRYSFAYLVTKSPCFGRQHVEILNSLGRLPYCTRQENKASTQSFGHCFISHKKPHFSTLYISLKSMISFFPNPQFELTLFEPYIPYIIWNVLVSNSRLHRYLKFYHYSKLTILLKFPWQPYTRRVPYPTLVLAHRWKNRKKRSARLSMESSQKERILEKNTA